MDVKTLCLGVLSRGEATGYEIKKQCEEGPFAHFYAAGFGSIYPALNALCEDGHVSVREVSENGRPHRKVYSITPSGRLLLGTALARPPSMDRLRSDFLFISFFGQLLPAKQIDAVIGERIELLRKRIDDMHSCRNETLTGGEDFTLGYGITVYAAAADYLEAHRHELVGAALRNELGDPGASQKEAPKDVTSTKGSRGK